MLRTIPCYDPTVSAKKALIRIGLLIDTAAISRIRKSAASSIPEPFLAVRARRLRPRQLLLRSVTGRPTCPDCRPDWSLGGGHLQNDTQEPPMASSSIPLASAPRLCSVDGCGCIMVAKGFCNKHYIQHKKKTGPMKRLDMSLPFRELAMSLLNYDSVTGLFTWARDWYQCKSGDIAGNINLDGYRVIGLFGKDQYAHRLAWLFVTGNQPDFDIDHIDGNKSNNSISNLRDVPNSINSQNLIKARSTNKSKLLGVSKNPDSLKWRASITLSGKQKSLGTFDTKEDAHEAYLEKKRELHIGCTI